MINGRADIRRRCLHGGCPVGFRHARVNAASGVFFLRWLAGWWCGVVAGLLRWLSTCVARNRVCIPWPPARERATLAELLIHASLAVALATISASRSSERASIILFYWLPHLDAHARALRDAEKEDRGRVMRSGAFRVLET